MRNLRLREFKGLAQHHIARKWWSWGSTLGLLTWSVFFLKLHHAAALQLMKAGYGPSSRPRSGDGNGCCQTSTVPSPSSPFRCSLGFYVAWAEGLVGGCFFTCFSFWEVAFPILGLVSSEIYSQYFWMYILWKKDKGSLFQTKSWSVGNQLNNQWWCLSTMKYYAVIKKWKNSPYTNMERSLWHTVRK